MALEQIGYRLYRYTAQELLASGELGFPTHTEYEKKFMCGFYLKDELADGLKADRLTQDPPISEDMKRLLREIYFANPAAGASVFTDYVYLCDQFDVPVVVLGRDAVDATYYRALDPGWDAAAMSSAEFYENGRVRFRVGPEFTALVGLQSGGDPLNRAWPAFSLLCNKFSTYIYTRGLDGVEGVGDFFGGDMVSGGSWLPAGENVLLTIEKIGRRVTFYMDGGAGQYETERIALPNDFPKFVYGLGATIFTPGGWVEGVEVVQLSVSDADGTTMPALAVTAGAGPILAGATIKLPKLRAGSRLSIAALTLRPLQVAGGRPYATCAATLPALKAKGNVAETIVGNWARIRTPKITMKAAGTVGTVGRAYMTLTPLAVRGNEGEYADAILTLEPLRGWGYAFPAGEARFWSIGGAAPVLRPYVEIAVTMDAHGGVASVWGLSLVVDGAMPTSLRMLDSTTLSAVLAAVMDTEVLISAEPPLYEQANEVWVANLAEGDVAATSTFEDYPFNSFGVIGGRAFGAKQDGVFLLEGDDDAGAVIRGSVSYGKQDFGTKTIKHMTRAYAGVSSKGTMFLKIVTEGKEYIYAARGSSPELQQQRFDVGRGLAGNYFTFELFNKNGGDFEIDSVSFFAAEFKRRI